jgi:hypothetical protein
LTVLRDFGLFLGMLAVMGGGLLGLMCLVDYAERRWSWFEDVEVVFVALFVLWGVFLVTYPWDGGS